MLMTVKRVLTVFWKGSIEQRVTNGQDFPPVVMWTERESETARSERLFMIFLDKKKMSGWIFTITGWLFSHTEATQLCSKPYKSHFFIIGPL